MDDLDSAIVLIPLLAVLAPLAAPKGADAGTKTATMLMGATGLPIIVAVTAMSLRGDRLAPAAVLDDEA